jgi:cytochrome oxidase Cu insertion factor (SCO1/SenC/PrrC family)
MRTQLTAKVLASGMLMLLASAPLTSGAADLDRVQRTPSPRPIADFELVDQFGKPRKLSSFQGAPLLVFFGFANCPDVCPTALHQLRLLMNSKDQDVQRAQVVMISVDGTRDTPAVMKSYLAPVSKRFIGLTGPPQQVRGIAAQFQAVFFKGAPTDNSGAYRIDHTSQVYLLDEKGKLRATFFNAPVETMRTVTAEISREDAA